MKQFKRELDLAAALAAKPVGPSSKKKAEAETDDAGLFAQAVAGAVPLKPDNRFRHPHVNAVPRPLWQGSNTENSSNAGFFVGEGFETEIPDEMSKNGRGKDDIRRLQSGYWPVTATLDLHGYRRDEAQEVLNEFAAYVQNRGVCGRIIHGSGLGSSGNRAVLKDTVRRWLAGHPDVLAYAQPHEKNDGALLVLFKKKRNRHDG